MVSMFANHFFNWTNQLKNSGHEVYWIDVFDNGSSVQNIDWVHQTVGWKRRFNFPGRQTLKRSVPFLYKMMENLNERELADIVDKKIREIKPDVVQSFVLFSACAPILEVMRKYPNIKWIYSAWGNDLFYFQNEPDYLKDIKAVLPRINYMFADCHRDYEIAREYGFKGKFLGVFPGGGGYNFDLEEDIIPLRDRKIILIKGYQKLFGECVKVLQALEGIEKELAGFQVIVFGADEVAMDYINKHNLGEKENYSIQNNIGRAELMKLMGKSLIYIGNSISDGTPNTMLEAMIMGAFPIQSNPGGVTEEWITPGVNGLLIQDPQNVKEIRELILEALKDLDLLEKAVQYNFERIKPQLDRDTVTRNVLRKYASIEAELLNP
ncbi:glycosyltransferase family 4 protein [Antarcticibacterium flavum]|uniref:Glycosyltransferase family 4 protein n=2 Tax=Flavobacteriaceae TaxID=49546 RepID=A0A5B7XA50_9FLAO|nr:glycosyl transferase family 1 [Antarcticibacterium sp. W02-3]QCY71461.1 glycosyltransferase family 4 protein [Antarcticibacterium flavum]